MSEQDDGPPLGVKDVAVLTGFVEIPRLGGKLSLKTLSEFTGIDAKEVFEILTFLEENEFIEIDRKSMM